MCRTEWIGNNIESDLRYKDEIKILILNFERSFN
jgi:hypothetical protein